MTTSAPPRAAPRWRRRAPWAASVAYVGALAIGSDRGHAPGAWLAALAALAVALAASGREPVERVAGWGFAIALASAGARGSSLALDLSRGVGALACAACACVAIARIPGDEGLAGARRPSPLPAAAAVAAAWWLALAARAAPYRGVSWWAAAHARGLFWAAVAASGAALLGSVEVTLRLRRLELGVVERAAAMRALLGVLLASTLAVAAVGHVGGERAAALGVAAAGALLVASAQHRDAVRVARAARRAIVLVIAGGGAALLGASVASSVSAWDAWAATMCTAIAAAAAATFAPALEAPMRPAGGAWLDAFAAAADRAACAEPLDGIRDALLALREPAGAGAPSPELWTFSPTIVTTVDAAGYLHERRADVPGALVAVASGEVEGTLRADVLEELEVRRPEIRPLLKWMDERGAILATVVAWGGEAEGVIVLPRAGRGEPVTLEEVRALRAAADRLAIACRARGTQARTLARANDAAERAAEADARAGRLARDRALDRARDALATGRLARPATVGIYSAASRMALDALERRTSRGAPIALAVPSGGDPIPYLARAHLSGARAGGPLVLVDATDAREHDAARWADPAASPLALAHGGMLVLLDGAALPVEVQRVVSRACADGRPPWDAAAALDVELALTGVASPDDLVAQGRLDPSLASRLRDAREAPVTLPRLRDRAEDVRAILTDSLARQGLRVLGRPVGIENAAYARLVEHDFPGEDAELAAVVERLVARCAEGGRDVVRAADLDAALGSALGARPAA